VNPSNIVPVQDLLPATLRSLIALLEASSSFEHLVYRESEMDALWTQADMAVRSARARNAAAVEVEGLERLFAAAQAAHDLVAEEAPAQAAARLRDVLTLAEHVHDHAGNGSRA
jgi:hypothetical protein